MAGIHGIEGTKFWVLLLSLSTFGGVISKRRTVEVFFRGFIRFFIGGLGLFSNKLLLLFFSFGLEKLIYIGI